MRKNWLIINAIAKQSFLGCRRLQHTLLVCLSTHFSLLFCLAHYLRPMSSHESFSCCTTIYCTSFLIFQKCTVFFCPDFVFIWSPRSSVPWIRAISGMQASCCCSVPLCSCLSSALPVSSVALLNLLQGFSPHEAPACLPSQLHHQTLQCFGLENWMLRCAALLVQLQYLSSEAGPWLEKCFVQLKQ